VGVGLKGSSPYRACALNGWVLDGEGHAMHKSLGNSIEPDQIIKHHGADLVRLWTASVEFHEDVRVSETILTRLQEAYRKLRNTFRYLLGNLSGFNPPADAVPVDEMLELDQWILIRAESLVANCRVWNDEFAFHKVYRALYDFATVDLSSLYFDVLKDRLYTAATKSHARRSAQTALYRLEYALVRLVAPILSFTAEEVWTHMAQKGSVHLELFPEAAELTEGLSDAHRKRSGNWDRLIKVREDVLKSLEEARREKFIGAPLEARVRLTADSDLYPLLEEYLGDLPGLFIVSQVVVEQAANLSVRIERADGVKCERCWKYTTDTGSDPRFPTICAACAAAVKEILHA
jgi:isoleucyl-tRNA synthetase